MIPQVLEFHNAFDLPVNSVPELPSPSMRNLRVKLLDEEIKEVEDAELKGDLYQIASELADVCYIAAGTALVYGIWKESAVTELFSPFDLKTPSLPDNEIRTLYLERLKKDFSLYLKAEEDDDLKEIIKTIGTIFQTCFEYSREYGIPLSEVFDEIHSSNMTKLGPNGKPVRREDGKVLKGPNYRIHNVRSVIEPRIAEGRTYKHYKGGLYEVLMLATIESTEEPAIVYRSLKYGTKWIRTCRDFFSDVSVNDQKTKRFTLVDINQ